jgi:hypothetical protein
MMIKNKQRRKIMNRLAKLCISIVLSLSSLSAAEAASETVFRRFNCVLERNGSMQCHEGHDTPCVCFFDVRAAKETSLTTAILAKLREMDILDASVDTVVLSVYGVGRDGSIHSGWDTLSAEQQDVFWRDLALEGYTSEERNLNNLLIERAALARYVIKLSYDTLK